jgi:hypothetical protein
VIQTQTFTRVVARTQLVILQLERCLQIVAPDMAERGGPLIERAFERDAFRRLVFYARRADGLTFGSFGVEFDGDSHAEQLRVCPEVGLDSSWAEGLAPDLKATAAFFSRHAKKFGKSVTARMVIRRKAWPDAPPSAPPILWVPGAVKGRTDEVLSLPELTCTVRLIDSAPV